MALRWGFKSEAAALAKEIRAELGLGQFGQLDPRQLAEYLGIHVVPLSDFVSDVNGAEYFLKVERDTFSALTVFHGHRRMLVHNDSHSGPRQNSNLAHELSHALLRHEPAAALDSGTGCRDWNDTKEEEAQWLAGELLVTGEMALAVARGRITRSQARSRLGVSEAMLNWRINTTGAAKRANRERVGRRAHRGRRPGNIVLVSPL